MIGLSARSRKSKGRRNEKRSQEWLERRGYRVVRAAGSKGVWDLWAAGPDSPQLVLVQVKTGRPPSKEEYQRMEAFEVGPDTVKMLHIWYPNARQPAWAPVPGGLMRGLMEPTAGGAYGTEEV